MGRGVWGDLSQQWLHECVCCTWLWTTHGKPTNETQHCSQQLEHFISQVTFELGWKDEYDFVYQIDREDYVKGSMDGEFSKNWALGKQSSFRT